MKRKQLCFKSQEETYLAGHTIQSHRISLGRGKGYDLTDSQISREYKNNSSGGTHGNQQKQDTGESDIVTQSGLFNSLTCKHRSGWLTIVPYLCLPKDGMSVSVGYIRVQCLTWLCLEIIEIIKR